jgi:hypothetical protein
MRSIARGLSIVLHPLMMPVYTLALAFRLDFHLAFFLPTPFIWITFGMLTAMTVLFPLASTWMLVRAGLVESIHLHTQRERIGPAVMTLFYYALAYWLMRKTGQHEAVLSMLAGALLSLALFTAVTFRWKISAHMVGIGGLIGALTALWTMHHTFSLGVLSVAIAVAGLLGTARLIDGGHTPAQIYAGALLGFACVFGSVLLSIHP